MRRLMYAGLLALPLPFAAVPLVAAAWFLPAGQAAGSDPVTIMVVLEEPEPPTFELVTYVVPEECDAFESAGETA